MWRINASHEVNTFKWLWGNMITGNIFNDACMHEDPRNMIGKHGQFLMGGDAQ